MKRFMPLHLPLPAHLARYRVELCAPDRNTMTANISPLAGKPAPANLLTNIPQLITAYYSLKPAAWAPSQRVAFGPSGHRGSAFQTGFNEAHILAIAQAVCDYRRGAGIDG